MQLERRIQDQWANNSHWNLHWRNGYKKAQLERTTARQNAIS